MLPVVSTKAVGPFDRDLEAKVKWIAFCSTATFGNMSSLLEPLIPLPDDGLVTDTVEEQIRTEAAILELLALYVAQPGKEGGSAVLRVEDLKLDRAAHVRYLSYMLQPLPTVYTGLDASRPWILYWVTHSMALLGTKLDVDSKRRGVETIKSFWNETDGGFGGGPGQMAHLAPTYASVSALAYLGEPEDAWHWIDRRAIHDWLLTLKQPDGSFVMHKGGEVDVRGCYCALTTAVLLNILTPDLAKGTFDFLASCQTYEGGLASASHPLATSAPALGEAHGGYTYCAFASHFILQGSPSLRPPPPANMKEAQQAQQMNVESLFRWASSMQGHPIEAGGFRGRTNKLVDGCYSWWCGGLFSMIEALLPVSFDADLFNRIALQEYVLIAAQVQTGGLRDKPGKGSDAYHSCYNLSGLAAAQHHQAYDDKDKRDELERDWLDIDQIEGYEAVQGGSETAEEANARMRNVFCSALAWKDVEERKVIVGLTENETVLNHPVYNLTMDAAERMLRWSYGQPPRVGIEEIE